MPVGYCALPICISGACARNGGYGANFWTPTLFQASESAILVESDAWHPTNIRNVDMAIVGRVVGRRVSINHQMPYAPAEKPCVFWCPRRCAAAQPPDSVRNLKPALFK